MPLTLLEDAYDTVANVSAFLDSLGMTDFSALDEVEQEQLIRRSTLWLDRGFEYVGEPAEDDQPLKWPRVMAYTIPDGVLLADDEAPLILRRATAHVAEYYREGVLNLEGVVTNQTAAVTRERVDVIEREYDTRYRIQGADVLTPIHQMLRPIVRSGTTGSVRLLRV